MRAGIWAQAIRFPSASFMRHSTVTLTGGYSARISTSVVNPNSSPLEIGHEPEVSELQACQSGNESELCPGRGFQYL